MSYKPRKEHQGRTELHSSGQNLVGLHSISFIQVVTQIHLSKNTQKALVTQRPGAFLPFLGLLYEGEKAKEMKKKKEKRKENEVNYS